MNYVSEHFFFFFEIIPAKGTGQKLEGKIEGGGVSTVKTHAWGTDITEMEITSCRYWGTEKVSTGVISTCRPDAPCQTNQLPVCFPRWHRTDFLTPTCHVIPPYKHTQGSPSASRIGPKPLVRQDLAPVFLASLLQLCPDVPRSPGKGGAAPHLLSRLCRAPHLLPMTPGGRSPLSSCFSADRFLKWKRRPNVRWGIEL